MTETIGGKKVGLKDNIFRIRTLFGFALAAAVIIVFLKNFDLSAAINSISQSSFILLILAAFVFYLSLPLRGWRWNILLKPSGAVVSPRTLSHYYFLSWFANAILPARIGDIYRAYLLKKNKGVSVSLSLGVIFSERVIDLAITAGLMVLSGTYYWAILKDSEESAYLLWGIIFVTIIIVVFVALMAALPWLIKIAPERLRPKLELFKAGIFRRPSLLPVVVAMTVLIWLSEALRLYLVFMAFGIKAGFLMAVFISQAALILMALPLSPAGLGLVELLMLKLLFSADISLSLAGAITLTDRLISYWSLVVSGAVVYILSPRSR